MNILDLIFFNTKFIIVCFMILIWLDNSVSSKLTKPSHHAIRCCFYPFLAIIFGIGLFFVRGYEDMLKFSTCYILEYGLSIDNLFVLLMISKIFHVSEKYIISLINYGISCAIIMRLICIYVGAYLIKFGPMSIVFGAILLWSAINIKKHANNNKNVMDSYIVRVLRKILPIKEVQPDHNSMYIVKNKKFYFTQYFLGMIMIIFSDLICAFDSMPIALSIYNDDPANNISIIYIANIMSIMGLRSTYYFVAHLSKIACFADSGLIIILAFIGIKLILEGLGFHIIGIEFTMCFSILTMVISVIGSFLYQKYKKHLSKL